jgi:hypothetical protein
MFLPDPRTRHHQQFCPELPCQKASKVASQQRWQVKAENRNYWQGPEQVERVRAWRRAHPEYWKPPTLRKRVALQDMMAAV